jgi:hypothetical protein
MLCEKVHIWPAFDRDGERDVQQAHRATVGSLDETCPSQL